MCEVCAVFGIGGHWTDAGRNGALRFPGAEIRRHRRDRAARVEMLNRVLSPLGLTCTDWDGEAYELSDKHGRQRVAPDLTQLWRDAESLSGRAVALLNFDTYRTHA